MPASIHWQRSRVVQCRHRDTFLIRPSVTQDHVENLEKGPVMRNLKSLLIAPISTVVALQDAFFILQESPSLEEFRIQSPLSYVEAPHLSGQLKLTISPIQLSFLKELTLHCAYYEQLRSFFQNVMLPEIISWDIVCLGYPIKHQDADPRSIIPSISGENSQCTTLELQICYRFVTINSDASNATSRCDDKSGSRRFSTYSWEDEAENFEERVTALECISFIYSVIKDGFWRSMRILRIEIEGDMSYSASPTEEMRYLPWIRLLETLPYLEELACRHVRIIGSKNAIEEMHFGLLRALARTHKDENGKVRVICPNLSVLRLCGMDFEFGLVHLVQSLTERGLNWSRLPKLELDKPFYMTKVTLRSLKESDVVGVIEVID